MEPATPKPFRNVFNAFELSIVLYQPLCVGLAARHGALPRHPAAAQISSDAEATGDASLPDELCEAAAQWL